MMLNEGIENTVDPFKNSEKFLAGSNLTPEVFMQAARERAASYRFPTEACLNPESIARYADGGQFSEEERAHLSACIYCEALIRRLAPEPESIEMFRDEVRKVSPKFEDEGKLFFLRWYVPDWGLLAAAVVALAVMLWPFLHHRTSVTQAEREVFLPPPPSHTASPAAIDPLEQRVALHQNTMDTNPFERNNTFPSLLRISDNNSSLVVNVVFVQKNRIDQSVYQQFAATAATVKSEGVGKQQSTQQQKKKLEQQYSASVANLSAKYLRAEKTLTTDDQAFSAVPIPSPANPGVRPEVWSQVHTPRDPGACQALALSSADFTVRPAPRENCVVRYQSAYMIVNPLVSVNGTLRYVRQLESQQGDIMTFSKLEKLHIQPVR